MSDCLFCKIVTGEIPAAIVYQDDKILVFKDLYPKAEKHLLVIPKKHYIDLIDIAEKNPGTLNYMMKMIPEIAKAQNLNNGYRTIINTGKGGGQVIFHLHAHLLAGKNLPGF
ncbi:MAG: histidine triad nucleotide-binding protein [Pseudomonadota bacterium]